MICIYWLVRNQVVGCAIGKHNNQNPASLRALLFQGDICDIASFLINLGSLYVKCNALRFNHFARTLAGAHELCARIYARREFR